MVLLAAFTEPMERDQPKADRQHSADVPLARRTQGQNLEPCVDFGRVHFTDGSIAEVVFYVVPEQVFRGKLGGMLQRRQVLLSV